MAMTILTLEAVYHETEIGRSLTDSERVERYESFDIGMDVNTMNKWQEMRVAQLDAKEKRPARVGKSQIVVKQTANSYASKI